MALDLLRRRAQGPAADAPRGPLLESSLAARVRQIRIRTHKLVNTALSGGYRSTFRGSGLEFADVRAYQPGDDVRRIDWNVTARTGAPHIKNYAEERELTIHFLVDTSRSMDFGSRLRTKREAAAQFVALLSFVALRHQDRVGLLLFGARPGLHLDPRKGGSHVLRLVREVLAAEPGAGGSGLGAALEHHARVRRGRRAIVFLVSDFLESPSAWQEPLARLSVRNDVIAVRVGDPLESRLPPAGAIPLVEIDGGRRLELDSRSAAVREAWSAAAARRRAEFEAGCARARADVLELDAAGDLGESVLGFFRRRALQRGTLR